MTIALCEGDGELAKSRHQKQIARNKRRAKRTLQPTKVAFPQSGMDNLNFDTGEGVDIHFAEDVNELDDTDALTLFYSPGTEEITENVIEQLTAKGWPEKDIREMKAKGFKYSRLRNSLVGPPERI